MVRIVMMEYLNMNNFFNMPDADMKRMLENAAESHPNGEECEWGGLSQTQKYTNYYVTKS